VDEAAIADRDAMSWMEIAAQSKPILMFPQFPVEFVLGFFFGDEALARRTCTRARFLFNFLGERRSLVDDGFVYAFGERVALDLQGKFEAATTKNVMVISGGLR